MKTMTEIRTTNDFEEAVKRYEACNSHRWKNTWWELICDLWKKSTKFLKQYALDFVHKTVSKIAEICKAKIHYVYWISLKNENNEVVFDKIGTAENPLKRWDNILYEPYCHKNKITCYEMHYVWNVEDREMALGLESRLRGDLIRAYRGHHVPTDRFDCALDSEIVHAIADTYLAA